jgi:predicted nucleic acid-binding protein
MASVADETGPFVVSPYVLAELDYLLSKRQGHEASLAALDELTSGAWELPSFGIEDLRRARGLIEQYSDQQIGLADASLVLLATRYRTDRLLTLDQRHFRGLRTISGRPFVLLPAAAP